MPGSGSSCGALAEIERDRADVRRRGDAHRRGRQARHRDLEQRDVADRTAQDARGGARAGGGGASSIEPGACASRATLRSAQSAFSGSHGAPVVKPAFASRVPRHRRAHRIAAEAEAGLAQLARILHLRGRDLDVADAELVAVVDRGRAAQREQEHRRDARLRLAEPRRRCADGHGCRAPSSASRRSATRPRTRRSARELARIPRRVDELEVEGQMDAGGGPSP